MIEDIFSKKIREIPEGEKIKIAADYREKNSLVIAELVSLGVEMSFENLEVGDFIVRDCVIERKTVSDFISSMIDKRLVSQLENMKQYKNKLLIIEGVDEQEIYPEKGGVNANAIRGFLLSILLNFNVPIIFSKNYEDSAKFMVVLAKKQERELGLRAGRKSSSKKEQLQYILEGFPGIGPKTAKKLLSKYKTIKNIVNTPIEELKNEIGKKAEIFKILNDEYVYGELD
ncbi:hypothetical protein HYW76_02360 [Candidatus Pacearchaeota archaeon]|nr:hypothetical protein [Candidatus Pacearchaeota archaeon]